MGFSRTSEVYLHVLPRASTSRRSTSHQSCPTVFALSYTGLSVGVAFCDPAPCVVARDCTMLLPSS